MAPPRSVEPAPDLTGKTALVTGQHSNLPCLLRLSNYALRISYAYTGVLFIDRLKFGDRLCYRLCSRMLPLPRSIVRSTDLR